MADKKPYGDVTYADPGYQKDGKARYPLDTEEHVRAAWSYINQGDNASQYSAEDLKKVKAKIMAACKKFGIMVSDDDGDERSARALLHTGVERRIYPAKFEVRTAENGTGGTKFSLRGYATVYNAPYSMVDKHGEYREQVTPGAGQRTLSQSPDVQLLVNHAGLPLARTKSGTMRLSEDSTGLHVDADLEPSDPDVQRIQPKIERGDLSEMSFAFKATRQKWNDDYTERQITEYNLHRGDVSIVSYGANPSTSLVMRGQDLEVLDEDEARCLLERLQRRLAPPETTPVAAMPLRLALALAQAQG